MPHALQPAVGIELDGMATVERLIDGSWDVYSALYPSVLIWETFSILRTYAISCSSALGVEFQRYRDMRWGLIVKGPFSVRQIFVL